MRFLASSRLLTTLMFFGLTSNRERKVGVNDGNGLESLKFDEFLQVDE